MTQQPILISSDEDEDDELDPQPLKKKAEAPLQPIPRNLNGAWQSTDVHKPKAHIPGLAQHKDLQPLDRELEMLHIPETMDDHRWMTPKETDEALRNLLQGAMNDHEDVEITPEDAVVKGFREGFTLMPHQVLGRRWMADREDPNKKRYGGILADDMVRTIHVSCFFPVS